MRAFIFPGQGSQKLKMGLDLYENFSAAKQVFEEVDDALGEKLSGVIFGNDAELLNKTENTQPALLAVSIATLRVVETQSGKSISELCSMVAGHSLGEYSALVAAKAMPLALGVRLLNIRGKAMAGGVGAMMAIIGLDINAVQEVCEKASNDIDKCVVANDNCPGQIVISGHKVAIEKASIIAKEIGAKKCIVLPVSIPAHSPLMIGAQETLKGALADVDLDETVVPFVSNRTAEIEIDNSSIQAHLVEQMVSGVRFRESVDFMVEKGIKEFVEIGSGNVLAGLVKRCTTEAEASSVGNIASVEEFLKTL